jgi:hypothetical protein
LSQKKLKISHLVGFDDIGASDSFCAGQKVNVDPDCVAIIVVVVQVEFSSQNVVKFMLVKIKKLIKYIKFFFINVVK